MLRSVTKLDNVFSILDASEFDNAGQINDFGSMNTGKANLVKLLSHGIHTVAYQMSSISRV
jgi:hypothetical protein